MRARSQVRDSIQLAANRDSEHKAAQDCFTGQWVSPTFGLHLLLLILVLHSQGGVQILQETTITTDRDVRRLTIA